MKNKIILFIFLSFIFLPLASAENYKEDVNGNYYVNEGQCVYQITNEADYKNDKYTIKIKEGKISSIQKYFAAAKSSSNYSADDVFTDGLSYIKFFSNKEFKCFSKLYISPYGFGIGNSMSPSSPSISASESRIINDPANYFEATLVDSSVMYVPLKENETTTDKKITERCYFSKTSLNINSATQASAPEKLYYLKYSDGTDAFVDSTNNVFKLSGNSKNNIDCNVDNLQLFIKKASSDTYTIVDSCDDGSDANCIVYIIAAYDGSGNAGELAPDGSSEGDDNLVDPNNITIMPPTNLNCNSLLGSPSDTGSPSYYIVVSFKIVRYVAIILLIVLSVMDMVSAVASSDSEIIQKTVAKIIKRLILCVIIFLLPLLINFILQFIDSNLKVCGVGE